MSLDLAGLKKVESSISKLVFGFCREVHRSFPSENAYYSVQQLIVYTCLAYYHIKHEWDMTNVNDECLIEGDYITKIGEKYDTTSVLKKEISNGIHEYEFKILSFDQDGKDYYDISIGIISTEHFEKSKNDKHFCFVDKETGYGYTTSQGVIESEVNGYFETKYGTRCNEGDIVKMTVDLDNYQLKYKVNDKDFGIAFDNIQKNTYKIALYLFGKGSKVQIRN